MAKAVLISIRPKWCELISSGEKIIEVRKTRPKLTTPFKCYIYCTKDARDTDKLWVLNGQRREEYGGLTAVCANLDERPEYHCMGNGKVIGEFVCDEIKPIMVDSFIVRESAEVALHGTCLTKKQLRAYADWWHGKALYNCKDVYGWHISNLVVYDTPIDLASFHECSRCEYPFCGAQCHSPLRRPPQSWCYVEELEDE